VELLGLLGERVKVRRTANVLPGTYEATPTRRDRSVTQRLGQRLHQTESAAGVLHHLGALRAPPARQLLGVLPRILEGNGRASPKRSLLKDGTFRLDEQER
jgi:hypothetical protein